MSAFLKAAIRAARDRPPPPRFAPVAATAAAAARLPESDVVGAPPEAADYDALARDFLARLSRNAALTARELAKLPWCLWSTQPAIAAHPAALTAALAAIEAAPRPRPLRALAASFLISFDPERPGMRAVAHMLARLVERLGRPWEALHGLFALFDPGAGPRRIAAEALAQRRAPSVLLRERGLGPLVARSAYARACAGEALRLLARDITVAPQDRLALVRDLALDERGKLVFEDQGPDVADALTLPFATSPPDKPVRDRSLALLLDLFKDPRLPDGRWARMPQAAAIVRGWLIEQTLRQFLDIVDRVSRGQAHMWGPRRKFWEAVYRAGLISEAWVVFETVGAQQARRAYGKDVAFATFSGVQSGQAVLLLRIGRGVVVEWSHSGKCIVLSDGEARDAPRLYQPAYVATNLKWPSATDSLDRAVFAVTHWPHEGAGSWQRKVARKLHQMTGVLVPASEYE
ncbi:EH signature domain-containing protein [Salinarimonas sp. NSM]|uniref:EH signature domain-containing protein n=1 Tax=Salinarimonas sp. NSM TaxID=3458003 RepID=UPI004036BE86